MSTASAIARPNIALIKYWGKADVEENLPASGSLSVTLDTLYTQMRVQFDEELTDDRLIVNGEAMPHMLARVGRCLDRVVGTGRRRARVDSTGNFPIAAGLASSASAFAALVVAASAAAGETADQLQLARQAGRASGSAARSLYGGFVELSASATSIDVRSILGPEEWPMTVIVAVTASGPKPVSSGDAMRQSADTSPFYGRWIDEQDHDLAVAREAVLKRDFRALAAVAEHNCLKMHSVMWSSRPAIVYWNSATVACMETIRVLQKKGVPVFFTIDAGPQLKAVCPPDAADTVADALRATAGVQDILRTGLGQGAELLADA